MISMFINKTITYPNMFYDFLVIFAGSLYKYPLFETTYETHDSDEETVNNIIHNNDNQVTVDTIQVLQNNDIRRLSLDVVPAENISIVND
jgi:hypothetical protein